MAAEIISVEVITAASPQNLIIPAGADIVLVMWGYYTTVSSSHVYNATLDGGAPDDSVDVLGSSSLTAGGAFVWYGVAAGTKALAWSKTTPSSARGPILTAIYISSGTTLRDKDAGNSVGSAAISKTIDSITTDLVLKCDTQISAVPGLSSGWTSVSTTTYGTFYQRVSQCDSPGAASTVCNSENENYSSLVAISIPELIIGIDEEAGVNADVEAEAEYHVVIDEGAGVNAESDADSPYAVEDEDIGIKAESDVSGIYNSFQFDTARVKAESDGFLMDAYISEGAGVQAESNIEKESYAAETVEAGISADADAYNYSAWVKAYGSKATKVFIFTLTGSADGVKDVDIPISSFQARKKSGDPTYLSVVIPTFNNAAEINARQNGDMVISAGYRVSGVITLLEEIIRGTLSDIASYDGPRSQSITLTGYKTKIFSQKTVLIDKENFTFVNNGKTRRRFSEVDLFLNPGDLLTVDAGTFEVGEISYTVSTNQQNMEVIEA